MAVTRSRRPALGGSKKRATTVHGINLSQQVAELDAAEEPLEGRRFAVLVSGKVTLGNRRHRQLLGIQTHMGNERCCGHWLLIDRAAQRRAGCHQGVDAIYQGSPLTQPLEQHGL